MRVDDPMLSMVATRRRAESRSGASVPRARQAPLNSSIPAISERISGVILRVLDRNMDQYYAQLHPLPTEHPMAPIVCRQRIAESDHRQPLSAAEYRSDLSGRTPNLR